MNETNLNYCHYAKQQKYRSFTIAYEAWQKRQKEVGASPVIYKCDKCNGWHFADPDVERFTR